MIQPLIAVEAFGATNVGKVRKNNEDCFISEYIWNDQFLLCAAIDGMGGYEGGEVAADIARFTLLNDLQEFQGDDVFEALKQAFVNANNEIVRHRQANPKLSSMGCVATVGLFDIIGRHLYVVHVGDSRLYRWQNENFQKLTHDHSVVGYREEIGDLTEEEAMKHPQRSVISRCVGYDNHNIFDEGFLETSIYPLLNDSTFLFCSDGLSDMLRSAEILNIVADDNISAEEATQKLINEANEAGGKDNITVVVVKIKQLHSGKQKRNDNEPTSPAGTKRGSNKAAKIALIIVAILALVAAAFFGAYKYFELKHGETPVVITPEPVSVSETTQTPEGTEISEGSEESEPTEEAENSEGTEKPETES